MRMCVWALALLVACGDDDGGTDAGRRDSGGVDAPGVDTGPRTDSGPLPDIGFPDDLPLAGNPDGDCEVPAEARPEDVSSPDVVIGDGSPASCTSDAVVNGIAQGGVITFDCGPDPIVIELDETAKIFNDTGPRIVIDGGGLVTLSGRGERRILYMNTCDEAQVWTTPMCQNQDHPRLTVQNLTFVNGDATGEDPYGGGAIFVRGGRFKVINSRFFNNACDDVGPDVGGASVRVLSQYNGLPAYIVNSTFGGSDPMLGNNRCSNGGGLSSIGVSPTPVINSPVFTHNNAIGNGANPAQDPGPRVVVAAAPSTTMGTPFTLQPLRHQHRAQPTRMRAAARSSSSATTRAAR